MFKNIVLYSFPSNKLTHITIIALIFLQNIRNQIYGLDVQHFKIKCVDYANELYYSWLTPKMCCVPSSYNLLLLQGGLWIVLPQEILQHNNSYNSYNQINKCKSLIYILEVHSI